MLVVAGFANRLHLLLVVVAFNFAGGSVSVMAAAAACFAVLPHDDGCRCWLSARFEIILEFRILLSSTLEDLEDEYAATMMTDADAVVIAVVVITGQFLGTSKSRRDVCLLLLRVRDRPIPLIFFLFAMVR